MAQGQSTDHDADHGGLDHGSVLFRLLTETVEEYALFAMDPQGHIVHWNAGAQRITGYSPGEVIGQPLHRIFTPEDQRDGLPKHELQTAERTGRSQDERWHVRKDGTRFWATGIVVPLRAPGGELLGFGKVLRDRTDIQELQLALQNRVATLSAADERKNVFIATLAHELRNPQNTLANAARLLRLSGGEQHAAEVADMIDRQVRHMKRLVDDLVDIVKAGRGKIQLRKRRIDLRQVIDQAIDSVRSQVSERNHQLVVNQMPTPIEVELDPDRIVQVLVNLLTNAIRYTKPGGKLSVTSMIEADEAIINVVDDGIGLSQEQLVGIFELFSQAHLSLPESQLGLGIGLALAKDLVMLHGGTIQARSEGTGKGTEFTVRLPMHGRGKGATPA